MHNISTFNPGPYIFQRCNRQHSPALAVVTSNKDQHWPLQQTSPAAAFATDNIFPHSGRSVFLSAARAARVQPNFTPGHSLLFNFSFALPFFLLFSSSLRFCVSSFPLGFLCLFTNLFMKLYLTGRGSV